MPDTTPTLRDRIRRAICEASGFTWLPDELMEPDEYGEHADAVLAVLPASAPAAPTDRAAVLREAADTLAAHPGPHRDELQPDAPGFWWDTRDRDAAAALLRRLADEAQPTGVAGPETLSALMATIQEFRALQQPLVDGLRFIWEDMDRVHKGGDEWATEWMAQVWMELPLQVRAAGGDTDAAQELADEARRTEPATAATEEPQP